MAAPFRPGDKVIWLKRVSGEFVFPVTARVLAVTDKRVKIEADDEDGRVVRHVAPTSLQPHEEPKPAKTKTSRAVRSSKPKHARPAKPKHDPEREERIENEIIVDAYDEYERAAGWCCYLGDQMQCPFTARCVEKRAVSPLHVGDEIEVIDMAPDEECAKEVFVMIRWEKDGLAVPLAQLEVVEADAETTQAVEDWLYWKRMGYEY